MQIAEGREKLANLYFGPSQLLEGPIDGLNKQRLGWGAWAQSKQDFYARSCECWDRCVRMTSTSSEGGPCRE
jgi:hypothetical protein